jgi:hypothetical protein
MLKGGVIMKETDCRKDFTVFELMLATAAVSLLILAMLGAVLIPMFTKDAHGADFTAQLVTDDIVKITIKLMKEDPVLGVKVVAYKPTWEIEDVDPTVDAARAVISRLEAAGIEKYRIVISAANKGTQFTDRYPQFADSAGTYLILTY